MFRQLFKAQIAFLTLSLIFPSKLIPFSIQTELHGSDIGVPLVQSQTVRKPGFSNCIPQSSPIVNANFEQIVVELVNTERVSRGIAPLKRTLQLDEASRYHATDMEQDNYFMHDSYDRMNDEMIKVCDWYTRIDSYYQDRSWLGENIATGYATPLSVMNAWMNSPGHRENILRDEFWEIGVGYFSGNQWVQDFGQRPGKYPIIINNEAAKTDQSLVSLYLYGSIDTWDEIRLRNNNDPWSSWSPFQNNISWQLTERRGEHIVTVEMRNKYMTTTSSDSIYLDIPGEPELGNIPNEIVFTYSIAENRTTPTIEQITPLNTGDDATLSWEVTSETDWITIQPEVGSIPDSFTISVSGSFTETTTPLMGMVNITVTSPLDVLDSPQVITVSLNVIDSSHNRLYLPTLMHSSPQIFLQTDP